MPWASTGRGTGSLTVRLAAHAGRLLLQVPAEDRVDVLAEWTDLLDVMGVILEDAQIPLDEGTWAWTEAVLEHNWLLSDHLARMGEPGRLLRTTTWEELARALLDY